MNQLTHPYPASLLCDFYKISHREQYPKNTQIVYSTWIPRASRMSGIDHVVAFGFQAFVKQYLMWYFNEHFFNRPKSAIVFEYKRIIEQTLGVKDPDASHLEALHDLGYLPVKIKALKEGTLCPLRVPMLTIENTKPEFFWLTNYLETLMSTQLWMPATSATIAFQYRKILEYYAKVTADDTTGVQFQGHDFSMRGMACLDAAKASGAGHLLSFVGTDTIPAILYLEEHYGANVDLELVGTSIPATEHSVMCAYGRDEFESYKRIITEIYPHGFVSIVSDTWDLWKVLTDVVAKLKPEIMNRDGRVVIRPDSGDPVKIICGDPESDHPLAKKGVIEILWETFGGTTNSKGYKVLDPHIGCIYGDAITLERCDAICDGLRKKGFASTNMVYGIGSYTYQHNTRDTFGFALKSTHCVIDGAEHQIYKDPATDNGIKKSLKGRVVVDRPLGELVAIDELNLKEQQELSEIDQLETIFENGRLLRDEKLSDIRIRLLNNL